MDNPFDDYYKIALSAILSNPSLTKQHSEWADASGLSFAEQVVKTAREIAKQSIKLNIKNSNKTTS
jgi:hypothetical protein